LGSVRANSNGEQFRYYPYGEERTSTADGRDKFGTYMRDNPGQDYADQRYYNVGAGRFNIPDPLGMNVAKLQSPGTWNRYSYALGDPVNMHDPTGMTPCSDFLFTGKGGEGAECYDPCDPSTWENGFVGSVDPSCFVFPVPLPPPKQHTVECQATLYSRPLNITILKQLGLTHAYWEVEVAIDGVDIIDDTISSGPQVVTNPNGKRSSDLDVWVYPTNNNPSNADTPNNSTWSWSSGWSASNCDGVYRMLNYANNWQANYNDSPTQGVPYSGLFGPNSNSFAGYLGQIGGFSPPAPPGSWKWGYWLH
jgi:RHS repeat-associated protein